MINEKQITEQTVKLVEVERVAFGGGSPVHFEGCTHSNWGKCSLRSRDERYAVSGCGHDKGREVSVW